MGKTDLSCMLQTSKLIWLKLLRLSCWICRKLTWWLFMKRRRRQPWYPLLGFSQLKSLWNKGQPKIMENPNLLSFKSKTTSTTNTKLHKEKSLFWEIHAKQLIQSQQDCIVPEVSKMRDLEALVKTLEVWVKDFNNSFKETAFILYSNWMWFELPEWTK